MNPPKCDEMDYINFLSAAQQVFSSTQLLAAIRWKKERQRTTPILVC